MDKATAPFISTQVNSGEYYYLNLTPEKDAAEIVVCGGREQTAPTYRIKRKSFKFYSIEFVSSGRGSITMDGKTYPLRPGAIYCYGPRTPHTIETDPEHPMLKHFVDFTGRALEELLKTTPFLSGRPLFVSRPFRIRNIFENLITTGNTESRNRDALCALLLRQLILTADDTAMDADAAFSPAWQTYMRCRQFIERNYLDLPNIGNAAEACFIDQAYLSRLFKRFADESPLQLLTRLKMSKAADLLSSGDLLVKQVGEKVGFSDPYHFSRVFKRVYGIPPETFTVAARRQG
ncbi:AraC family transcriptional regulator [Pontiella agarivorans]|uniref:AraC family transcriptional regulator n=1 Tax=Pontiella agarivorans TaxID=3038953 RepID=A0ABU5MTD9_9BACT|nr:AraC family transcriptional regulator [Pontiella agarivorans]MDZ8117346.1 AraC family transcriptional regulator [Pontiella agarivorans]